MSAGWKPLVSHFLFFHLSLQIKLQNKIPTTKSVCLPYTTGGIPRQSRHDRHITSSVMGNTFRLQVSESMWFEIRFCTGSGRRTSVLKISQNPLVFPLSLFPVLLGVQETINSFFVALPTQSSIIRRKIEKDWASWFLKWAGLMTTVILPCLTVIFLDNDSVVRSDTLRILLVKLVVKTVVRRTFIFLYWHLPSKYTTTY